MEGVESLWKLMKDLEASCKRRSDTIVVESIEVVSPIVKPVVMEVQSPLVDQSNAVSTGGGSYHNYLHKELLLLEKTLIRALSERFVNTAYGFFLGNSTNGLNSMLENGSWFIRHHPLILQKWNSDVDLLKEDVGNVPVWVKLHGVHITAFNEDGLSADDVELKDTIMMAMPKIMRDGVFGYTQEEFPKNIAAKNLKKPSQTSRGVLVGPKVGFKPHKEYRPILKKPTASSSDLLISGQAILMGKAGNHLKKVECPGDYESEDEVASVDNDMAHSMPSERDLPQEIQAICDNLDIRVRGHKKK
nr:hypothetical protein [Tanacetum cinerariifolium]